MMTHDTSALPTDRAVAADAVEPVPVSPVPASIPSARNFVIDATMGMRGGLFCFCPVELNDRGEITSVITGLTILSDVPPGKLVAIVHEDGQDAVEGFHAAFSDELAALASAMSAGTAETQQAAQGDSPPARPVGDAQGVQP